MPRGDAARLSINACYGCVALIYCWLVTVLVIEWHENLARLRLRLEEAHLLSSTFCNSTRGARLAMQFALCGDAEVMVQNKGSLHFKAFEKTIRSVAIKAITASSQISLSALGNVAAVAFAAAAVAVLCNCLTKVLNGERQEIDVFSPVAQARLNAYIDMAGVLNTKQD